MLRIIHDPKATKLIIGTPMSSAGPESASTADQLRKQAARVRRNKLLALRKNIR